MKKFVILLLTLCSSLILCAQDPEMKSERRVYLWDVTLSMQGRAKGCPDIWDDVKKAMCDEIRKITDEKTEVVILPFQHRAISEDLIRAEATVDGKDKLIKFIQGYQIPRLWVKEANREAQSGEKGNTTMTALYAPLKYCVDNILINDKINVLELMTDGVSDFTDDQAAFDDFILSEKFCNFANENDVLMFFVALTKQAKYAKADEIKCPRIIPPDSDGGSIDISYLRLTPQSEKNFNTQDDNDKPLNLMFSTASATPVRPGYKVRVKATDNPYMRVDQVVTVASDYSITLTPEYLLSTEQMNILLANGENPEVCLTYERADGMDQYPYLMTTVSEGCTRLTVINTRQKKVEIRWE